jgi:hypothetical protein
MKARLKFSHKIPPKTNKTKNIQKKQKNTTKTKKDTTNEAATLN